MAAESSPSNSPSAPGTPSPRPRVPRLPGMEAESFGGDMSWRRGVGFLWVLFALAAAGEALNALFYLLAGSAGYPSPMDVGRLCAEGALFVALWLGWGWLRWPLAAIAFFQGAWLIVWLLNVRFSHPVLEGSTAVPPGHRIDAMPPLFLGIVYGVMAFYLVFSADVLDFLRHRREESRRWVVLPVMIIVVAYLATLFDAQPMYLHWLTRERAKALPFAMDSLKAMSEKWDPQVYTARANADVLADWPEDQRTQTFASLQPLGPCLNIIRRKVTERHSAMDPTRGGFVVNMECDLGQVNFAHGDAQFSMVVTRTLFGSWQLGVFEAGNFHFDPASAAKPQ